MRSACLITTVSALGLVASAATAQNWVDFDNETQSRLVAPPSQVVNDNLEKDFGWGDFDQDGDVDLVVMIKFPGSIQGGWPNLLLMNEDGVLTDRTAELGTASDLPLTSEGTIQQYGMGLMDPTNDREVDVVDVDNDGWLDLITATTMSDQVNRFVGQPRVYMNLGNDGNGNWLGFRWESARIPELFAKNGNTANPRFCDLDAGDLNGDGYVDLFFTDYDTPETSGTVCIDLNGDGNTNGDPGECQLSPGEPSSMDYDNKYLMNWGDDPDGPGPGHFFDTTNSRMTSGQLAAAFGNAVFIEDMNGDGTMDVVRINTLTGGQNVATIYNKTGAQQGESFNGPDQAVGGAPYNLARGDLDNDGDMDMVVIDDSKDKFLINTGNDGQGFANFTSYTINDSLTEFGNTAHTADLDNDGFLDLLVADVDADLPSFCPTTGRRAHIYHHTGGAPSNNMFQEQGQVIPNSMLAAVYDMAPIDINNDGWLDLVIGRCAGIQVWMNQPPIAITFGYPDGLPTQLEPGVETEFTVDTDIIGGGDLVKGTLQLFTSVGDGDFVGSQLEDLGDGLFGATLPAVECGESVSYYVSGELTNGNGAFTDPPAAPKSAFGAISIDEIQTVVADTLESGTAGWTVVDDPSLVNGGWEAAIPNGSVTGGAQAAPSEDGTSDGVIAFVTQNANPGQSAGTGDVDGGPTTLTSPMFDLSGTDGVLSYNVWFFCDDAGAFGEDSLLVEISNDGGANWSTVETIFDDPDAPTTWENHSFLVSSLIEPTGTMQVRWTADDSPNNSVTEAGVDDFFVEILICDETPDCVGDLDGSGEIDGADLGTLLAQWGNGGSGDLNNDGSVDGADLGILLSGWGGCE